MMWNQKNDGNAHALDYAICLLMVGILLIGSFLLPQIYSKAIDKQDMDQVNAIDRGDFTFQSPIDMTVGERVQQMMSLLSERNSVARTLSFSGTEITDGDLLEGLTEEAILASTYGMFPDISAYLVEENIQGADYYNLSASGENTDVAFWIVHFTDNDTFDFNFIVDANDYTIYGVELYSNETNEEVLNLRVDWNNSAYDNMLAKHEAFIDGCVDYFESEGYDYFMDPVELNSTYLLGFERGSYIFTRILDNTMMYNRYGIEWGFEPMFNGLGQGEKVAETEGVGSSVLMYP